VPLKGLSNKRLLAVPTWHADNPAAPVSGARRGQWRRAAVPGHRLCGTQGANDVDFGRPRSS